MLLVLLAVPSPAAAQRDAFFGAVVAFYRASAGVYGDEGPQVTAQVEAMSAALERWDRELRESEGRLRTGLRTIADRETRLQIHTTLAALYLERGRLAEAVAQLDEDITLDPRRAGFHRLKGMVLEAASREEAAADAYREAWLLEPGDPLNAYRLIALRSRVTTDGELVRARETLSLLERALVRRERPGASAPFTSVRAIRDEAGGGIAFVPAVYAAGFAAILEGRLDEGVAALRAATVGDPLIADPASASESMGLGISSLRQGDVAQAIAHLESAVASHAHSSEARRALGTAFWIAGDIARSVEHLGEAVRLSPRDERVRLALARVLAGAGRSAEADEVLRNAIADLPEAGAVRWQASSRSQTGQDEADRELIAMADRLVLLVGKGELYRSLAGLAQLHLDDAGAVALLERAVRMTPNDAAAHKALGRAYFDEGRETEAYAELVMALLLNPGDADTLTSLGRWHLALDEAERAVEALERAVGLDPASAPAVHALAGALLRVGRTSDGQARLGEASRLQAQVIEQDRRTKAAAVLRLDAEMRAAAGDAADAVEAWRRALEAQPDSAIVHLRLAEALAADGRGEEAVREYVTAISRNAGTDAYLRLAALYDSLGRTAEARRERASYVERRLEELQRRAAEGLYGQ